MSDSKWCDELVAVRTQAEEAEAAAARLRDWLWRNVVAHDVLPRALPEEVQACLQTLSDKLSAVKVAQQEAFERYLDGPAQKFFAGRRLSREEYYLVAAMAGPWATASQLGLLPFDDYALFELMYYEDDERRCYINPDLKFKPGRAGGFGKPPELLKAVALRPEQHEFFAEFMPEVYRRFRPQ